MNGGLFVIGYLPYFSFSSHHGLEKITSRICCDGVFPKQQVFVIIAKVVITNSFSAKAYYFEQQRCL